VGPVVGGQIGQDVARLVVGQVMEQGVLLLHLQMAEDPHGGPARQRPEEEDPIGLAQVQQKVGHFGRGPVGDGLAEHVPAPGLDELQDLGPDQRGGQAG
jgi:hypothetical protein